VVTGYGRSMVASIRILFIDDDDAIQRAVKRTAEAFGYEVLQALDGPQGLELAAKERIDVILLDINMPMMDGRDVLKRLKQDTKTAGIPVLMLSTRDGQYDRQVALELGADDFSEKPFETRLLFKKIERVVQSAHDRRGKKQE
jgi:DNA-binding response OmpR family regulator